jgi:2'-5' RNA ligase
MARPEKLRLFVALDLPAAARAALAAFRDAEVAAAGDVWRPVRDEALHLTLAFLGHRPEDDVALIAPVLEGCAGEAPPLALGAALLLPPRRARVLCASVADGEGVLAALQARVSAGLSDAGVYEPETRPFRAHATVARLRSGARPPRAAATEGPEPLAFHGEALTLYRSSLRRGGAQYEPLSRVPLAPA